MDYPYTQQAPGDTTPSGVVRSVIAALHEKRWADVAALVDPHELGEFARAQVAELRKLESGGSLVDALRARSALAPDALERYAQQEAALARAERARFSHAYGEQISSQQLAELPPQVLLARWLAASHPSEQVRRAFALAGPIHPDLARAAQQMAAGLRREIATTEYDGPDIARVVYREWFGPDSGRGEAMLRSTTLRRTSNGWRMEVDAELMGHADLTVGMEPTEP